MPAVYRHEYVPISMYGNVVALLRDNVRARGLHIDVGCGYGAIADPVRDELGLTYIGFDTADDGLASLRLRGFETHLIDLGDIAKSEAIIRAAVGDRVIASVTFLDTLEHVVNGPHVVALLRRLAEPTAAILVLSVPNVTHKDIALKLLLGRWDVTEAGLLDHTHVDGYSNDRLKLLMDASGWRQVDERDWLQEWSDQHFPDEIPLLDHTTRIGHFLRQLIEGSNRNLLRNQFVRAYEIAEPKPVSLLNDRSGPDLRTFTILFAPDAISDRVGGVLNALTEQTCQDFQMVLVRRPVPGNVQTTFRIEDLPAPLRNRSAIVESQQLNRAAALNEALAHVAGRHVILLREQDSAAPIWLATLADLASHRPRAVLRVGARTTDGRVVAQPGLMPISLEMLDAASAFAVPASVFSHLGLRFDETMLSGESIDLIVRSIALCGENVSNESVVIIGDSEGGAHASSLGPNEQAVYCHIIAKLDAHPHLLPTGGVHLVEQIVNENIALREKNEHLIAANRHIREEAVLEVPQQVLRSNLLREFLVRYGYVPAARKPAGDPNHEGRPFLSIVTRTRGNRIRTLREAMMSLAAQSSQNFEFHLVVHTEDDEILAGVRDLVAEFPSSLTARTNVIQCKRPGRSAPLNDAVEHLRGRYVAVLDDDDFVFAHWVEVFEKLARQRPGAMLRATCVRQDFELSQKGAAQVPRSTSWFKMEWPSNYDAVRHLYTNYSPFMSMAFPIEIFTVLDMRWSESLSTSEDWHFAIHVAMNCGVVDSPEVTSVYRWWTNSESSLFQHHSDEWSANLARVVAELDAQPIMLPPGSASQIRRLIEASELSRGKTREPETREPETLAPRLVSQQILYCIDFANLRALRSMLISQIGDKRTKALMRACRNDLRGLIAVLLSPFFDEEWYLNTYEDVRGYIEGAVAHFVLHGRAEGRSPGPFFDPHFYVAANPDVKDANVDPFFHYTVFGWREGRVGQAAGEGDPTRLLSSRIENSMALVGRLLPRGRRRK